MVKVAWAFFILALIAVLLAAIPATRCQVYAGGRWTNNYAGQTKTCFKD